MIFEAHNPQHKDINGPPSDRNTLLDSTFDIIAHILQSNRCSFMLLDAETAELRVGRAKGLSPEIIARSRAKLGESIAGLVASRRRPLLVRDLSSHPEVRARAVGGCQTDSMLSVPVEADGKIYGVLNVTDKTDGGVFDEQDLSTLNLLAAHLALCIEHSALQAEMKRLANVDGLTEVYNHRYFHERLNEEIERADRFGRPLSLLMIDVNEFKEFNDAHGHLAGDFALREIAAEVRKQIRQFEMVSRYGGDEFTVTLPETDSRKALRVAERLARSITAHSHLHPQFASHEPLTVSIGVSTYPSPAQLKHELIEQADRAMYRAKQRGFPHVLHWDEMESELCASGQRSKVARR